MQALVSRGLLLGAYDKTGRANAMTIGWGSIGSIWGLPMWIVLVRPSRYTYECIEHSRAFTVCAPGEDLAQACGVCGTKSGRQGDKLAECGLTVGRAAHVAAPVIEQCPMIYECQVVHYNDVVPSALAPEIQHGAYRNGDYHRVYYGKIIAAEATADAARLL